jgi:hypothetical protein
MDGKVKLTGKHLIAALASIETSCAAVRQALESLPRPESLVLDFDTGKAAIKGPPHLLSPGACELPLPISPGDLVQEPPAPTPGAPEARRGKGSQQQH